jgi:2-polyprenyl-3-methyl-5-hydroxy-6-metoxy-1,4-benzoquinol methylase
VATDEVRREWDAQAATFDLETDHGLLNPVARAAWWDLFETVLPLAPARVADLGSGTGSVSVLLAQHGYDVTGVDLSPRMVDQALAKAAAAGVECTFLMGDASSPSLAPRSFDVVVCRHVLWALPDPAAALERWVELLSPSGRLVLIEGQWSTGAGLTSDAVTALLPTRFTSVELIRLTRTALWGREISDDRYCLVATESA